MPVCRESSNLLRELLELALEPPADQARLADIQRRAGALIRATCGDDSPTLAEWRALRFRPYSLPAAREYERGLGELSRERALALLEQAQEGLISTKRTMGS